MVEMGTSVDVEDHPYDVGTGRDPGSASGRNLEAFLLFELFYAPSYGYSLAQCLGDYGFGARTTRPSVVYRVLRLLEAEGAISSTWATQESGPSRRYYELTEKGCELLDRRLAQLRRSVDRAQRLLRAAETRLPAGGPSATSGPLEAGVPAEHARRRSVLA